MTFAGLARIDRLFPSMLNPPEMKIREALLRPVAFVAAALVALSAPSRAAGPDVSNWSGVLAKARGETVYFNAWGGSDNINSYIEWAGE